MPGDSKALEEMKTCVAWQRVQMEGAIRPLRNSTILGWARAESGCAFGNCALSDKLRGMSESQFLRSKNG
ncbi:MAG: hypothetical protein ABJ308_02290 [Halieaceae bacterium]